jgi:hypothetical protein
MFANQTYKFSADTIGNVTGRDLCASPDDRKGQFFPLYVFNAICGQTEPVLLAYGPFDIAFWCIVG